MAEIVNLNKRRKSRARAEAMKRADATAARFGRTKAEKQREAAQNAQANRQIDDHKLDRE